MTRTNLIPRLAGSLLIAPGGSLAQYSIGAELDSMFGLSAKLGDLGGRIFAALAMILTVLALLLYFAPLVAGISFVILLNQGEPESIRNNLRKRFWLVIAAAFPLLAFLWLLLLQEGLV